MSGVLFVHFTHFLVDSLLLLAPFALYPKTGAFSIFITGDRNSNNTNDNYKKKKKKRGVTNCTLHTFPGRLPAARALCAIPKDWRFLNFHHR